MRYRFTAAERHLIEKLPLYIQQHLHLRLTVSKLAALLNLSPHKLDEGFLHQHGLSLSSYIKGCRMGLALLLLRHTDEPIKVVASMTGYRYKNFQRQVHQYYRQTAGQLRRDALPP